MIVKYELHLFQNGCQYMRHAKRKKLSTEDFNKALRASDVQVAKCHVSWNMIMTVMKDIEQMQQNNLFSLI